MDKHAHHHGADDDWEERASHYNEVVDLLEPELGKATKALLEAAHVKAGSRVLDVACGPGHTAAAATAVGADATGMDSSPTMIGIARERFPGTRFVEGDMLAPPEGPWDAIICRLGAHHADPSWLSAACAVLKPGGRIALAETDAVDEEARAKDMQSPDEWVKLLAEAGFGQMQVVRSGADLSSLPESVLLEASRGHDGKEHPPPKGPIYIISGIKR